MTTCRAQHRSEGRRAAGYGARRPALVLALALAALLFAVPPAAAGPSDAEPPAAPARLVAAAVAAALQAQLLSRRAPGSPRHRAAAHRALALRALVAAARRDAAFPDIATPSEPLAPAVSVAAPVTLVVPLPPGPREPVAVAAAVPIPGPLAAARSGPPEPPGRPVPDIAARLRPDGGTRLAPDPVPLHWDSPTRPTVPLAARDGIILPGHGPIRRGWGEPGPDGEPLRGLELGLPPGAPILAPLDGTVRYAGYFAGLGPILIIAHAGGYHSLIAGVGSIDVQPGQEVLAGEPVATMRSPGRLQDPAVSLYYELRFQGRPIPPISGLAAAQRRGRG